MSATETNLPPPVAPPRPKTRTWRWVLLGVGITVAVMVVGLIALGLYVQSQPILDDDMNRGDGPFIAESDPHVDLRYENGGYVMDLVARDEGNYQQARSFWEPTRRSVDLSISYDIREAPDARSHYGIGLGCVTSGGTYWLNLEGSGFVGIYLESAEAQFSPVEDVLPDEPQSGRLRLVCSDAGGDAPTRLTAFFDGREILSTEHSNGFGSFQAMTIAAGTIDNAPMTVVWDDAYAE